MDIDILAKFFNDCTQKTNDLLTKSITTTVSKPFDYLKQVERDIEHFKQFGRFKENDKAQVVPRRTVKQERLTEIAPQKISTTKEALPAEHVHIENVKLEMPPPTKPLKTNRKLKENGETRITRSKIKKETEKPKRTTRNRKITLSEETNINRDSDVILQNQEVVTISLVDNECDVNNENVDLKQNEARHEKPARNNQTETEDPVRSSRRNTRKTTKATISKIEECQKRLRSPSSEDSTNNSKPKQTKTKRVKSTELTNDVNDASIYEDAISNDRFDQVETKSVHNAHVTNLIGSQVNETTVVISKSVMDATVVLHKLVDINGTIKLDKQQETGVRINETVTVEKPKIVTGKTVIKDGILCSPNINSQKNYDDLMTDDESLDDTPLIVRTKKTRTKPIFSPFENSPVKQRVKAFEKLGAGTGSEVKETRTIPRITKEQKWTDKQGNSPQLKHAKGTNLKTATPLHDRNKSKLGTSTLFSNDSFVPKSASALKASQREFKQRDVKGTSLKTATPLHDRNKSKLVTSTPFGNDSFVPKSASALKASQREFKQRELQRKEKDAETVRKRDALLQAQIDERRLKREEKQLKAQQAREARDLEKQKILMDTEKVKEEKLKQVLAEKQHKLAMQREEAERRRHLAAKKAAEEKRKEKNRVKAMEEDYPHDRTAKFLEQKMKEAEIEMAKKSNKPKYLTMKAPLLPSADCYDSDDDRGKDKQEYPEWNNWPHIYRVLVNVSYVDNKMKNTFFCRKATTPDLQEIFANIDPKKLNRTSSAIWKKPPRFTLMHPLGNSIVE